MKKLVLCASILVLVLFLASFTSPTDKSVISAQLSMQNAFQGKKVIVKVDIYYFLERKEILMHYTYPDNFIQISNILGETTIYFPKKNEVMYQHNEYFSANSDILFLFLTQNMSELGLTNLGFTLISTSFDGSYMITRWKAPDSSQSITEVELVFEDYIPIYMSSFSKENVMVSKAFYSNYQNISNNFVPLRITEISYVDGNDSIVSRKDYSNLKFGSQVRSDYINFKIPDDAKITK